MHQIDISFLNLKKIEIFLRVAELGSFKKASDYINISLSAVGKNIILIENLLGIKLFVHNGNKVRLTSAGQSLYSSWIKVDSLLKKSVENAYHIQEGNTNIIQIGVQKLFQHQHILEAIKDYNKENPNIKIYIEFYESKELSQLFNDSDLDMIYCLDHILPFLKAVPISVQRILPVNMEILVNISNPLSKKDCIQIDDLRTEYILTNEINHKYIFDRNLAVEKFCSDYGFKPNFRTFVKTSESINAFLELNYGVAFSLDQYSLYNGNPNIKRVPLNVDLNDGLITCWHNNEKKKILTELADLIQKKSHQ